MQTWSTPAEACFSVHNHGEPIPAGERERIFQPLERGLKRYEEGHKEPTGLGLGLYICREIVRSHDGRLQLESSADDGTTFSVTLPRAPAA